MLPTHFAHHPLCNGFKSEIYSINVLNRTYYICRGCSWVTVSTLFSFLVIILVNPLISLTAFEKIILILLITSPTWLGVLYSFQNRILKDLIRGLLGIGFGIALGELILTPYFLLKIYIFGFIIAFLYIFSSIRKRLSQGKTQSICLNCQERNLAICEGFKQQVEAQRKYSEELSNYIQEKSSWIDIKQKLRS